jgi:hypothetical protein
MTRQVYHVTPVWRVKRAGAYRADSIHTSKASAIARGDVSVR